MDALRGKVFRGWPSCDPSSPRGLELRELYSHESKGLKLSAFEFLSQSPGVRLTLFVVRPSDSAPAKPTSDPTDSKTPIRVAFSWIPSR